MAIAATGLAHAAEHRPPSSKAASSALRKFLDALDHLVPPPPRFHRDAGPPPEWFKYPPI